MNVLILLVQMLILEKLIILLSPFAPHISEEIWEKLGNSKSISEVDYPIFDQKYLIENEKNYPINNSIIVFIQLWNK